MQVLELLCTSWHYSIDMNMSTAVFRTLVVASFLLAMISVGCMTCDPCGSDASTCCIILKACEHDTCSIVMKMTESGDGNATDRNYDNGGSGSLSDCNLTLDIDNYTCSCMNSTLCISITNDSANSSMTTVANTMMDMPSPSTTGGFTTVPTTDVTVTTTEVTTTTVTSDSTTTESLTSTGATADPYSKPGHGPLPTKLTELWLWVALGVPLILIICVLAVLILCIIVACCRRLRHHKRKESPTTMDIVSKWEDVPDESSDIKLVSIKSMGDDEGRDGEKENNGDVAKNEETKKNESGGEKEEKKDGDITLGTFGFPEVVVEPTAFKAENEAGDNETEKNKGDGNEGNTADKIEQKAEEISNKGPKKSVDESTTSNTGTMICNTSADKQNATTEAAIPQDKQNTTGSTSPKEVATIDSTKLPLEEGTKPEPVPVNIPTFGNQQKEELQALVSGSGLNTSADKTDQPASPTKQQALSTASKEITINAKVSTDTEPAAATEPQAQTTDVQPLLSDKPSDATGGLLAFEDIEKVLGLVVKGVSQDDSTQM